MERVRIESHQQKGGNNSSAIAQMYSQVGWKWQHIRRGFHNIFWKKWATKRNPQIVTQEWNFHRIKFDRMHLPKSASEICRISSNASERINNCGIGRASTLHDFVTYQQGGGVPGYTERGFFSKEQGSSPAVGKLRVHFVEFIESYSAQLRHYPGPWLDKLRHTRAPPIIVTLACILF